MNNVSCIAEAYFYGYAESYKMTCIKRVSIDVRLSGL